MPDRDLLENSEIVVGAFAADGVGYTARHRRDEELAERRAERNRLAAIRSGRQQPSRGSLPPQAPEAPAEGGSYVQSDLGNQIITMPIGGREPRAAAQGPAGPPGPAGVLPSSPEEAGPLAPAPPPEEVPVPPADVEIPPPEEVPSTPEPIPPSGEPETPSSPPPPEVVPPSPPEGGDLPPGAPPPGRPSVLPSSPQETDPFAPVRPPAKIPGSPEGVPPSDLSAPEPLSEAPPSERDEWPRDWSGTGGNVPDTPSERSQIFGIDSEMPEDRGGIHHVPDESGQDIIDRIGAIPDMDPEEIGRQVGEHFGGFEEGPVTMSAPEEPPTPETAQPAQAPGARVGGGQGDGSIELLREIRDKLEPLEQVIESAVTALETLPDTLRELLGYGE